MSVSECGYAYKPKSTHPGNTKVTAALAVDSARLEERLARWATPALFLCSRGGGGNEDGEGEDNDLDRELHGCDWLREDGVKVS